MDIIKILGIPFLIICILNFVYRNNKKKYEVTNKFDGCFQKADFSVRDYDVLTEDSVLEIFSNTNWEIEFEYEKEAEKAGNEYCPSGISILFNNQHVLHICPRPNGNYEVFLHFGERKRIFFFIPTVNQLLFTKSDYTQEEMHKALSFFFNKEFDLLKKEFTAYLLDL